MTVAQALGSPSQPLRSMDDVLQRMESVLEHSERAGDHRAVFQRVYLLMTHEMKQRLASGLFLDRAWMEQVLIRFAQSYFDALESFGTADCPPAWQLAFDQAATRRGYVLQDALLGINAHINRDLPFVMEAILRAENVWPDARRMLHRHRDHNAINRVLAELVDKVQDELTARYARLLKVVDAMMGRRDEAMASLILNHCRTTVWYNTERLLDAQEPAERAAVQQEIEQGARTLADIVAARRGLITSLAPIARQWRLF